ncbi:glycosyltransferase family 4 protein [Rheinheimera sp. UJ51]|uniref:glycosyltransferase family 4 protein n=1 Tax=Rheinheimera sp. UJ51 TaxID=2892446 RepID=UPI001E2AB0E2|nr:glycosyltransferase family 4 protein [Rheinheimera sp. UJ51]MCC5450297.1 glycosyltransferase family 4 protein [Rheinheimera sp. UJ51]
MPLKKQRIAIVGSIASTILGFRGDLIAELVAAGHQVFAFATDYNEQSRILVRTLGAIPVDYQLSRFGLNPITELKTTWQLYQLFKQHQISLSFCYFAKPVIYGTLAAWLAKVPLRVAKIEGLGRPFTENAEGMRKKARLVRAFQVWLFKRSLPKAHLVFFLNPEDKHDLIETHKIKVQKSDVLSGIGVHLERYAQVAAPVSPIRFIFVGRLLNEKGIRYFLTAAEALKKRYPNTEFIVLGEPDSGSYALSRQELQHYVDKQVIYYPGKVANVVPFLAQSSVFVLPTYYREGVPRSTQEAMAVGRAVITTDMPGCRQTVKHGENGFLVPPHDQEALEQAMLQFIQQPALIEQMGQKSREMAEKQFDVKQINAKIMQLLAELA